MIHYLFLTVYTIVIFYLTILIWKKTREIAFCLGIVLIYYWSLMGAWFIIFDDLTGQKGKEFGLHYYHFFERLFPVHADNYYLQAISLYALFIIGVQCTILYFAKMKDKFIADEETEPVHINHWWLILFCITGAVVSCALVWKEILTAAKFNQSIYVVTRHQASRFFTIHQLLNQATVVALYIGLISYISGAKARLISGSLDKKLLYAYAFAVMFVEGYLLLMGNKREILFGGILGIIFYLNNVNFKINFRALAIFIIIILIPLFFNDGLRTYSPVFLTNYFDVSGLEYHPDMEIVYSEFSVKGAALTFLFSNEMFCAHFSMYGVLSHHVPLTYGTSMVSLGASLVPRVFWPNRPGTIYDYYVDQVHAMPGQGYTINHATGWYLNFGIIGVIVGAFVLGFLWTYLYNRFRVIASVKRKFFKLFFIIGMAAFTAQIPSLIRGGPEGYKALLFEGLLIPVLVVYLSSLFVKKESLK